MAKSKPILKPGTTTPKSGQYAVVGPKGGKLGTEVTSVAGKPLPPTRNPRNGYVLGDPTQHKK